MEPNFYVCIKLCNLLVFAFELKVVVSVFDLRVAFVSELMMVEHFSSGRWVVSCFVVEAMLAVLSCPVGTMHGASYWGVAWIFSPHEFQLCLKYEGQLSAPIVPACFLVCSEEVPGHNIEGQAVSSSLLMITALPLLC